MKILIEQGCYPCFNIGDLAMLQVTYAHLRQRWPEADILVPTLAPDLLAFYLPEAVPVDAGGRALWFFPYLSPLRRLARSPGLQAQVESLEQRLHRAAPHTVQSYLVKRLRKFDAPLAAQAEAFAAVLAEVDLVVASGGGYITDVFYGHARRIVTTMGRLAKRGVPLALFGQGLGPFTGPELYAWSRWTFRQARLITLREARESPRILREMGLPESRFTVTGDDAVSLAFPHRPAQLGTALGLNVRLSAYAELSDAMLADLQAGLQTLAARLQVPFLAVPISRKMVPGEYSDSMAFTRLTEGLPVPLEDGADLAEVQQVIRQAGRCRVVVTGSYHSAVFPLSQGVPVVALAKSQYYADKFQGLADQFGPGCTVLRLDEPGLPERLVTTVLDLWKRADELRPGLLQAAERQSDLSQAAYARFFAEL